MKKALLLLLILFVLLVIHLMTYQNQNVRFDDAERNRMILSAQFQDAKENLKRGFPFDSSFFEGKDAFGNPVRFETDSPSPQIRSAGKDKIFNTDDDYLMKD